jgi:plasmid maintenance system killer protein
LLNWYFVWVDISFDTPKLSRECNSQAVLIKRYGQRMATLIRRRLDDLDAVLTLEDMRLLPGRCHERLHDRAGQLSLDLVHPQRLIFIPAGEPVPHKTDGGLDWHQIKSIRIIGIEDTHE